MTMRQILMAGIAVVALAGTANAVQEHHQAQDAAPQLAQQEGMPSQDMTPQQPQSGTGGMPQTGMSMPCPMGQGGMGMMGQGGMMNMPMMGQGMMGQGGMGMMTPGMMGQGGMMNMPMMGQGGMGVMCPGMMGQGGMMSMPMMCQGMMGQGGMGQGGMGMMGQGGMMKMPMMGHGMMGQRGMGMMHQGMMGQGPDGDDAMAQFMAERVEGHIAFLRAELKITDQQQAPWDKFAEALRANSKSMMDARAAMTSAGAPQTLPDRLDRQEKMLSARLSGIATMKASLGELYGALSAEQRKTADELLAHPMFFGRMAVGGP